MNYVGKNLPLSKSPKLRVLNSELLSSKPPSTEPFSESQDSTQRTGRIPPPALSPDDCLLPDNWLAHPLADIASLAPIQWLSDPVYREHNIQVGLKREDLLDPACGGNKVYKLYYHTKAALEQNAKTLVTFGGAYSNHLFATAALGAKSGLNTVGIVRGERPHTLSPTLQDVELLGMELVFISRQQYREKASETFLEQIYRRWPDAYIVPEGGGDALGAKGMLSLMEGLRIAAPGVTDVCMAMGTGSSFAGLMAGAQDERIHGFPVLKLRDSELAAYYSQAESWSIANGRGIDDLNHVMHAHFHGGGYAKYPDGLKAFQAKFEDQHSVLLDPIYTAKLMWGVDSLIHQGYWPSGSVVVAIHSGGLQGRRGFTR